jgi:type IV pilus assembly protein PilA
VNGPGAAMETTRRNSASLQKGPRHMLSRIRKSMADKDQGFTLIELLVVIIIIGILAAIAIPVFLNQRKKGVDAGIKSDLKNMATLQETYMVETPSDSDGLPVSVLAAGTTVAVGTSTFTATGANSILVASITGGYCIRGSNVGSSKGGAVDSTTAADLFFYNSATGGITATAC